MGPLTLGEAEVKSLKEEPDPNSEAERDRQMTDRDGEGG
jgi:hypothetical protein